MSNIVLDWMKKNNIPLTKDNYASVSYLGNPPEELEGEEAAETPSEIKDVKPEVNNGKAEL